jgi:hypothetical protein
MIVELKAHPQNGICHFVSSKSCIEKGLTEVSAKLECRFDMRGMILFPTFIQVLTKLPAALPRLFLHIARSRKAEHSLSMHGTETGQRVAQSPAFTESALQGGDFLLDSREISECFTNATGLTAVSIS